jgi:hypothetical protein
MDGPRVGGQAWPMATELLPKAIARRLTGEEEIVNCIQETVRAAVAEVNQEIAGSSRRSSGNQSHDTC